MSNEAYMWKYWRDDKGFDTAIEDYYTESFETDKILSAAELQYNMAELTINKRMKELSDMEDMNEDD